MKKTSLNYLLFLIPTLFLAAMAQAKQPAPFFSPYPDARLEDSRFIAGEETKVLDNNFPDLEKSQRFSYQEFIGDVSHYQYLIKNVSTLAVVENYKQALSKAGFVIKYQCSNKSCGAGRYGTADFGEAATFFKVFSSYHKPKYVYAIKESDPSYVLSLFVGQNKSKTTSHLSLIKVKPVVTGLITADVDAFSRKPSNKIQKPARNDVDDSTDHSLLTRYPGAYIQRYQQMDYDEVSLVTDVPNATTKEFSMLDIIGDVTHITYVNKNISTLKIYHNYVAALTNQGFETVFSCQRASCSKKRDVVQKLGDYISADHVYNFYHRTRYLLMKNSHDGQTTYVAVFVGDHKAVTRTQLVVVRTEPLQKGLIKSNSDQVTKQLEQKGKASIYGIFFDYDKAEVKSESAAALKVITEVLNKNKSLNIYVVGHTDDKGNANYNVKLSQRRAAAVVKALVKDFNIAPARLTAHGAGPFSPAATNRNDMGRQLNRRVELVERLAK